MISQRHLHITGYDTLIMEEACLIVGLLSMESQHMASHIQIHASTTGIGVIDSVILGVEYMPGLVSISTQISRAYFLGQVAKVGDNFLEFLCWGSLALSAPTSELT